MSELLWPKLQRVLHRVEKPMRYVGAEMGGVAPAEAFDAAAATILLAFPDIYEIGASYHGFRILYERINAREGFHAERAFAPWTDFESEMRNESIPLYAVESFRPATDFDVIGFTLQHEMNYTNVLNMIDLTGLPLRAAGRGDSGPLVIAGGEGALSPELMAPFVDAFVLGDSEESVLEILGVVSKWKKQPDRTKSQLLEVLAGIDGIYVPGRVEVEPGEPGRTAAIRPAGAVPPADRAGDSGEETPESTLPFFRRRVFDLSSDEGPIRPPVPMYRIVHDRHVVEIRRGCTRGCRFCSAGMINRHVRERPVEQIVEIAEKGLANTGYRDLSLLSLSTGDYSHILPLVDALRARFADRPVAISLPSLRMSTFDVALADRIGEVRKTGFTFAPEAGTERLRRVINKRIDEAQILEVVDAVCAAGWQTLKFYFMIGLPTETDKDLQGIVQLVREVERTARRHQKRRLMIHVTLSPFVPKPHTPFQWEPQIDRKEMARRFGLVADGLERSRRVKVKRHSTRAAYIEAVLARGDGRLADALERAWQLGCRLDAWSDRFRFDLWERAFDETDIDPAVYANRVRESDEVLPWDHIDAGPGKAFLLRQYEASKRAATVEDCTEAPCPACKACAAPPGHKLADGSAQKSRETRQAQAGEEPAPKPRQAAPPGEPPKFAREQAPPVLRVRLSYSKEGRLRYLSHLDMVKSWQLLIEQAGLPVAYSRGFHPIAQLQYSPPLAVGYTGKAEIVDLLLRERIAPDEVAAKLNGVTPDGMRVFAPVEIDLAAPAIDRSIDAAEYEVTFHAEFAEARDLSGKKIEQVWHEWRSAGSGGTGSDPEADEKARRAAVQTATLEVFADNPPLLKMTVVRQEGNLADPRRLLERMLGYEIRSGEDIEVTRLGLVARAPRPLPAAPKSSPTPKSVPSSRSRRRSGRGRTRW